MRCQCFGDTEIPRFDPRKQRFSMFYVEETDDYVAVLTPAASKVVQAIAEGREVFVWGWPGPELPGRQFSSESLKPIQCGALLVDIGGRWECMPAGVKVFY